MNRIEWLSRTCNNIKENDIIIFTFHDSLLESVIAAMNTVWSAFNARWLFTY